MTNSTIAFLVLHSLPVGRGAYGKVVHSPAFEPTVHELVDLGWIEMNPDAPGCDEFRLTDVGRDAWDHAVLCASEELDRLALGTRI